MPRYLSILANCITFRVLPYDIFPWWLFFVRWQLHARELVFFAFVGLMSIAVVLFEPQGWTLKQATNFLEVLIFSGFLLMGHSLFEKATPRGFLKLALAIALLTLIDYHMLHLKLTYLLTHLPPIVPGAFGADDRGAFILATEPSYWALVLLGFYAFALIRRWWLPAFAFALLLYWNKGIYATSLMLLCSMAILPPRAAIASVVVAAMVVLTAIWLDAIPLRTLNLIQNIMNDKYSDEHFLLLINEIEEDHGSRRYSNVINAFLNSQIWFSQPLYASYSFLSQLLLNFGWIRGVLIWVWLLVLVAMRHPLTWREFALMVVLTVIAGPVSIPFVYSFIFARALTPEPHQRPHEVPASTRL